MRILLKEGPHREPSMPPIDGSHRAYLVWTRVSVLGAEGVFFMKDGMMIATQRRRCGVLAGLLLAAGCGGIPEALVDVARDSAKAAVEKEVDEILSELLDGLLDEADLATLLPGATPTE